MEPQQHIDTEALTRAIRAETMASEVKESFLTFRTEVHEDLQNVRSDMKSGHGEIQGQLRSMEAALTGRDDRLTARWFKVAGAAVAGLIAMVGWLIANGRPWS